MAPINPYLLRTGMPYASHEFSFDTDMYNTRWCFVIDDTNDPHKYFRAVFTSTRGNFDDKSKEFNKEEFRCLLLCCFQIMLEDMRLSDRLKFSTEELTELLKISQDNINKLKLGDFRTMPGILANILLFFFPQPPYLFQAEEAKWSRFIPVQKCDRYWFLLFHIFACMLPMPRLMPIM